MINQFQESLWTDDRTSKTNHTLRSAWVQTAIGLMLVIAISAFGIFTASHATGQENMVRKPAMANVLPELFISDEALEPNLNGLLATGDGGASLPIEETVGGVSRNAFDRNR